MVGILLGLMLLVPLWGAVSAWRDYLLVHQSGMFETQAMIVRRYVRHGYRSSAFRVLYSFRAKMTSGEYATFSNRRTVGLSLFKELANSPELTIRYLPSDPRISEIEGNDQERVNASILSGLSLLMAIPLVLFIVNPKILTARVSRRSKIVIKKR